MTGNLLLICTGSVACIKIPDLLKLLKTNVKIIYTKNSLRFLDFESLECEVYFYEQWEKIGDEILHIELSKWADVVLVAPCSANTLSKLSNGLCDDLATNTLRAWDFHKPMFVAPAMNTQMLNHPVTQTQLNIIQQWGAKILEPRESMLACGVFGLGAMQKNDKIAKEINSLFT